MRSLIAMIGNILHFAFGVQATLAFPKATPAFSKATPVFPTATSSRGSLAMTLRRPAVAMKATEGKAALAAAKTTKLFTQQYNVLYDSKCSLCQTEIDFLRSKDKEGKLFFTDIEDANYDENDPQNGRLSYEEAMKVMHAVDQDGNVVAGAAVFPAIYKAIGLGWIYAWADVPFIAPLYDKVYNYWAKYRTQWTRGKTLEDLYTERKQCQTCTPQGKGGAAAAAKAEAVAAERAAAQTSAVAAKPSSSSTYLYVKAVPDNVDVPAVLIRLLACIGAILTLLCIQGMPWTACQMPLLAS